MPIRNMAQAFARIAQSNAQPESRHRALTRIRTAMITHPHMVGGTRRFDSDLMREADGIVVCKSGAAALQCMGLTDRGIGIAIKIEDANAGFIPQTSMQVLRHLDALSASAFRALDAYCQYPPVTNTHDEVVGRVETTVALQRVV
jgi:L-asparaginase II